MQAVAQIVSQFQAMPTGTDDQGTRLITRLVGLYQKPVILDLDMCLTASL